MLSKDAKSRESSADFGVNKYGKHQNTPRCAFFPESAERLSQVQKSSSGRPEVGVGDRKAQKEQSKSQPSWPPYTSAGAGEGRGENWGYRPAGDGVSTETAVAFPG